MHSEPIPPDAKTAPRKLRLPIGQLRSCQAAGLPALRIPTRAGQCSTNPTLRRRHFDSSFSLLRQQTPRNCTTLITGLQGLFFAIDRAFLHSVSTIQKATLLLHRQKTAGCLHLAFSFSTCNPWRNIVQGTKIHSRAASPSSVSDLARLLLKLNS